MTILTISFVVSFLVLIGLLKTNLANMALDVPNHRSLHTATTPRTGGLAIMLGVLLAFSLMGGLWIWIWLILCLMAISLCDDIFGISIRWRFLVQVLVAIAFIYLLLPQLAWYYWVFASILLVWMMNLYNFMDGTDGLAGGMAVFGFSAYALAAYSAQNMQLALMCGTVVSASLAFLCFNFHPAKIFMGDAGSIPLGFLAGAIGLCGWQQAIWPVWFPMLVFSPFIVDATVTLFKRLLRGERIWQAHREHYYQRLVLMGWGHKKTALAAYLLMFLTGFAALLMLKMPVIWVFISIVAWVIAYLLMMLQIDKQWKQQLP